VRSREDVHPRENKRWPPSRRALSRDAPRPLIVRTGQRNPAVMPFTIGGGRRIDDSPLLPFIFPLTSPVVGWCRRTQGGQCNNVQRLLYLGLLVPATLIVRSGGDLEAGDRRDATHCSGGTGCRTSAAIRGSARPATKTQRTRDTRGLR
jgi:hypothetical protein